MLLRLNSRYLLSRHSAPPLRCISRNCGVLSQSHPRYLSSLGRGSSQPATRGIPVRIQSASSRESRNISIAANGEKKGDLAVMLNPSLLRDVYSFWFQHVRPDEHLTLPTRDQVMKWFSQDAVFDKTCVAQYGPVLESIKETNASADEILRLAAPSSALEWLGLVILLDQMPRNCYRDAESIIVYNFFDPLALQITLKAIDAGIPSTNPDIRYSMALRFWFYLSLVHSEDAQIQDRCLQLYLEMMDDINRLLENQTEEGLTEIQKTHRSILTRDPEYTKKLCEMQFGAHKGHRDIIVRFGRYPHRNKALGRTSTAEEQKYLDDGNTY